MPWCFNHNHLMVCKHPSLFVRECQVNPRNSIPVSMRTDYLHSEHEVKIVKQNVRRRKTIMLEKEGDEKK